MGIDPVQARRTAKIMVEALPYIQRFQNKAIVIKYGGNAMVDETLQRSFVRDIIFMKCVGMRPVIVHGAGPQISESIAASGRTSQFIDGLRVTDADTMAIVEEVLVGTVNKRLVGLIAENGGEAVGLGGRRDGLIRAKKLDISQKDPDTGEVLDIGYVGEVTSIDVARLTTDADAISVIAPVGVDASGQSYNINADTVAGAVAKAMDAEKLIIVTNTDGVLDASGELISELTRSDVKTLIEDGVISAGMLPKITCALHALEGGVRAAQIVDGRLEHSVLLEVFTDGGVGTLITS